MPYTLANLLTLSRIGAIPILVALLYLDGPLWAWTACVVFTIIGLTDWLDGYVARRWGEHTAFGRLLGPDAANPLGPAPILAQLARQRHTGLTVSTARLHLCRESLAS